MPKYRPARSKVFNYLTKSGLTDKEATELSGHYSMSDLRTLPYLVTMLRWRRLYGTNLAAKGYGKDEIQRSMGYVYQKKGWHTVWDMLRAFRKQIISSGGDPSPGFAPKRSHHSRKEITQEELNRQAKQLSIQRSIDKQIWGT